MILDLAFKIKEKIILSPCGREKENECNITKFDLERGNNKIYLRWSPLRSGSPLISFGRNDILYILNAFLLFTFYFLLSTSPAKAEDAQLDNSVLISADEIEYHDSIQVVNAFGEVEVIKNDTVIWADEITYNKAQNIIMAKGNITFKNADGNISYGSAMEFNNDMKTGFILSPQGRMIDETRIAASKGSRESDTLTTMENVVYSPCEVCKGDENPIWQIKAKEVQSDEETMDFHYKDAWLEIYGTPVLYTPYLTHPDPRVKKRSGFLPPTFENSSDVGMMLRNYYYWDLSDRTDATFELTAIDLFKSPLLGVEVRHLADNGEFSFKGSIVSEDSNSIEGHLKAEGKFNINDHWRTGFVAQSVTEDPYFEKYGFDLEDEDMLTSEAYIEGFYGNDYIGVKSYKFTDLRPSITVEHPLILPIIEYSFKGDTSNWTLDGDFLALDQDEEAREFRFYNQAGIEQNYLSTFGMSLDVGMDLYTRAYLVDKDNGEKDSIFEAMPQLSLLAKYPLKKTFENGDSAIIEPIGNLIIAPNGANNEDISLQDSTILDLDYTNLFSKNRLSGVDRLEDGIRSSYGVKTSLLKENGGYSSLFLGQTYRHRENDYLFTENSGLSDKFSDIILEMQLKPNDYINLDYYALLDKDNLQDKKHEAYFSIGKDSLKIMGSYLYSKEGYEDITDENSHELSLGFYSHLSDYWKLSGTSRSSLGASGEGLLKAGLNLEYIDECFSVGLYGERDLTNGKGTGSDTTIMFKFGLKNLGEFKSPTLSADFLGSRDENNN